MSFEKSGFKPSVRSAEKKKAKLRIGLDGPPGAGKTMTALLLAKFMIGEALILPDPSKSDVVVVDSERNSAELYADAISFRVIEQPKPYHSPHDYIASIREAEKSAGAIVLDSITHEWAWCLQKVDELAFTGNKYKGNKWAAWSEVRPPHDEFIDAIMGSSAHVFATMRAKPTTVQDKDDNGKTVIRKLGLEAMQDSMLEFAFGVMLHMDVDNCGVIGKTRCSALRGRSFPLPGELLAQELSNWINSGAVDYTQMPRSIREAVEIAISLGISAGLASDAEAYKAASNSLLLWCKGHGISKEEYAEANLAFGAGVKKKLAELGVRSASQQPAAETSTTVSTDAGAAPADAAAAPAA